VSKTDYEVIIGLEIHIQTKTETKMFCSCPTNYFGDKPNTHVCPTCLGLPGALPVPNKKALELCILMGLATNCDIENEIHFDRKHYFYPDLPKGYQISQYKRAICTDGYVTIRDENNEDVKIEIERIHQEEDVAKSTHHKEAKSNLEYSLIDYNKSGVPLIEIVTRPTIRSAYQAKEYATKIRQLARYLDISDADMEKGQMRCEPNISVQKKGTWKYEKGMILPIGDNKLNAKVEVKNIGSITAVEKSIEYEIERMISQIEEGNEIRQQTRGWNANINKTEFQRSKETADDYRYMPEPDIPVIEISVEDIESIAENIIELPQEKFDRYLTEYNLSDYDAGVLTANRQISEYFEKVLAKNITPKSAANWITGPLFSISNDMRINIDESTIPVDSLCMLIREFDNNNLTKNKAEGLLKESLRNNTSLVDLIAETAKESDSLEKEIGNIIDEVINTNQKAVNDYKSGNQATLGFLVGQVMQKTKGNADPNKTRTILMEKLNG
jgi:aspartyl-tRNA(Asn)/glutamyl-tRNA(Gln) amidotransferase subunit B